MKLYQYVHCPFCIRVRMVLSYLNITYESIVLPYDDEKTPMDLSNLKMLPIMEINNKILNESLEIIKLLDTENKLKTKECVSRYAETEKILNRLGSDIHSLAMPYFIWTPEFDDNSRKYFQDKKEIKRGPFKKLVQKRKQLESSLLSNLEKTSDIFDKSITKESIDLNDILIASHLWAMYIVPEFQFSEKVHQYLQDIKAVCNFEYHGPYWSN